MAATSTTTLFSYLNPSTILIDSTRQLESAFFNTVLNTSQSLPLSASLLCEIGRGISTIVKTDQPIKRARTTANERRVVSKNQGPVQALEQQQNTSSQYFYKSLSLTKTRYYDSQQYATAIDFVVSPSRN
jgi:hypothetical protein